MFKLNTEASISSYHVGEVTSFPNLGGTSHLQLLETLPYLSTYAKDLTFRFQTLPKSLQLGSKGQQVLLVFKSRTLYKSLGRGSIWFVRRSVTLLKFSPLPTVRDMLSYIRPTFIWCLYCYRFIRTFSFRGSTLDLHARSRWIVL